MATQKIHFFTGKGGVGKSVVSAGYALAAASVKPSKILLTELSDEESLTDFFPSKQKPTALTLAHWNAQNCLEEYATSLLRSSTLSKLFLNNTISKALINVAPGLQELALLGKATSTPRQHGPPMNYDEIFIDAFATGHFLNLMSAPQSFAEIFSFGPMATQSRSIDEWIKNPEFTHVHIVTLADELATQEAIELQKNLADLKIRSNFILNRYVDTQDIPLKKLPEKTKNFFQNIDEQQKDALIELRKTKSQITILPQIFENTLFKIVQKISVAVKDSDEV